MAIQVRHSGAWVDNTQEKKRVNGAWVSNEPYKVMKPYISGVPPFTFKSDGENLRDWSMSGQSVQASTPTPANPVAVEGVGERTSNWFDKSATYTTGAYTNLYTISGLDTSQQYTCSTSLARVAGASAASIYLSQTTSASAATNGVWAGEEKTFTPNENGELYVLVRNTTAGGAPAVADDVIAGNITIMLNTGSTALPFEPHGVKIPITCGGTTTNIYLGSASTTRRIKKLVLTGSEDWRYSTASQAHWVGNVPSDYDNTLHSQITAVCTHYKCIRNDTGFYGMVNGDLRLYAKSTSPVAHELYIKDETYTSAADFKTYLAQQYANGTPVTIWYVLATPETAAVNEPLMKIGSYADELTKTGAGVNIPTVSGSNTLTVGTTVQPSEMSIESISQWV